MTEGKILKILLIISAVIMISGVIYYGLLSIQRKEIQRGRSEHVLSVAPDIKEALPDIRKIDTSDWKLYTNQKFGFEVKWPGDWIEYAELGEVGFQILSPLIEGSSYHRIVVMAKQMGDFSLREYIEDYTVPISGYQVASKRELTINGVQAYEVIWEIKNEEAGIFEEEPPEIFVKGPESLILLSFHGKGGPEYNQNVKIFYAMVSTLRFLK
jgi:hypothetical protein